jgi:hypothetical protein
MKNAVPPRVAEFWRRSGCQVEVSKGYQEGRRQKGIVFRCDMVRAGLSIRPPLARHRYFS